MSSTCSLCQRDRQISSAALRDNVRRNGGQFVCRWCKVTKSPNYQATRNINFGSNPAAHKPETIAKAAASRRGKFGENANAWRGGSRSLNAQVKAAVYRRHQWQRKIYERDGWKCTQCSSTDRLDAHHLTPFSVLLKSLKPPEDLGEDAKINWLADHPILVEAAGTTLCRSCHKAAHRNWGSHYAEATS